MFLRQSGSLGQKGLGKLLNKLSFNTSFKKFKTKLSQGGGSPDLPSALCSHISCMDSSDCHQWMSGKMN